MTIERTIDGFIVETDRATSIRLGRVRQRDTAPEVVVRKLLHAAGVRFRTANRDLPGSPDVANRTRQWAIFVHGCYWHRHEGCARSTMPSRNVDFWTAKFEANIARDRRAAAALEAAGYHVVVVWECETKGDVRRLAARLRRLSRPT